MSLLLSLTVQNKTNINHGLSVFIIWCATHLKGPYVIWWQRRPWSACAYAQPDLGRCSFTESVDIVAYVDELKMPGSDCRLRCGRWSWFTLSANCIRALFVRCTSPRVSRNVRKRTCTCAQRRLKISLRIHAVWSDSLLCAWKLFVSLTIQNVSSEDPDQTAWMRWLIWIFAGRPYPMYGFWRCASMSLLHRQV